MWRNGQTAAFMNHIADFARRFSFQVGQLRTDTEKMTIGGRDLDSGENGEIIDWETIQAHQTLLEQIIHSVACVVISDSGSVQAPGACGRNQIFRTGNTVSGKKRMRGKVDIKRHGERLWLLLSDSLLELFYKNDCFGL